MIPRAVWFGEPEYASPRISPDGRRLAWLAPVDGRLQLHLDDLTAAAPRIVTAAERSIMGYFWTPDGSALVYLRDDDGDEGWQLVRVDLTGGAERPLTPAGVQASIERVDSRDPRQVAITLNQDDPHWPDPYRLDLGTGELTKILANPGMARFVFDPGLDVRAGIRAHDDGSMDVAVRREGGTWFDLLHVPYEDAVTTDVVGVGADGRTLWVVTPAGRNAAALLAIDTESGEQRVLSADPVHDVVEVELDRCTGELRMSAIEADRLRYTVHDPALGDIVGDLQSYRDADLVLHSRDRDDRCWAVSYVSDTAPPVCRLWDREQKQGRHLFDMFPALGQTELAAMQPFEVAARDGVTLRGYLTEPLGPAGDPPPAVLVHGGPWMRDSWGYRPDVQWLADRGYVCIQVNFRGSTGYGRGLVNLGNRQWGAAMQDDLIDVVCHLVERGAVDPGRLAIMGSSYGGYAALMGAIADPEVFRCAVAFAAPTNLISFCESIPAYWTPQWAQLRRRVGDIDDAEDRLMLWDRSPLAHVERLRVPVLVAHGGNDPRVTAEESRRFVDELQRLGLEHEALFFPNEGHALVGLENRLTYFARVESFLARQLGGRLES